MVTVEKLKEASYCVFCKVAIVPFQAFADSSRGGIVERHVQCAQSPMHLVMRPSSLGGGRILRRTLSVRLSVRPSRYHYRASRRAT